VTKTNDAKTAGENVKTAGRTLDVLEVFARSRRPMSLTEVAQLIDAPVSSAHALLGTLRARGYIYSFEDSKLIYPTKRILSIAQLISRGDPLVEIVLPEMRRLLAATNETIIFGKRQAEYVTYLEVLESNQSIRYSAQPGDTKPLHSSAVGKAMLSLLGDKEITALIRKAGMKQITGATLVEPEKLLEDIRQSRERGFFVTRGENVADVSAVSVVLRIEGEPLSIAIAGPIERLSGREAEFGALLLSSVNHFNELEATTSFR
jgi:IclR family acetate operon transcriptional repressor